MNSKKAEQINRELITKQFEFANIDLNYDRLLESLENKEDKDWFMEYTITVEQYEKFQTWAVDYISKKLRLPKYKGKRCAQAEFNWWNLKYRLKISDIKNLKI